MLRPVPTSAPVGVLLVALSVGLVCNFDAGFASPLPDQAPKAAPVLHITVLEGEDGVNILKTKMAVKPVVEVRDQNNLPVSGAAVVFLAPDSGPRVAFAHGSNTFVTTTDASGRATAANSKPIGRGSFKIRVRVDFHGQTYNALFGQTNFATAAAATAAGVTVGAGTAASTGLSALAIAAIVAGAAAVATGVTVALTRGSKPGGTIGTAGSPTLSAP
jgi:hypothetical protein